jgi:hypothetical protein
MLKNVASSWFNSELWVCRREYDEEFTFLADIEADARAKMLCYLLENKLLALRAANLEMSFVSR